MHSAGSSQSSSRTDERRRSPRLRSSSIIFAHLGPDNGGIVTNLGMDGVACHAAMKVTAQKNSTLNIKLRGSGLNLEIVGELVWLGATQKEAGICFKSPSVSVQQEVAEWIGRQSRVYETPAADDSSALNASAAMPAPISPATSPAGERASSHSFAAALAMVQAQPQPVNPPADVHPDAGTLPVSQSVDSSSDSAAVAPLPEIASPAHDCAVPENNLGDRAQFLVLDAESSGAPSPRQDEMPLHELLLQEISSTDQPFEHLVDSPAPSTPTLITATPEPPPSVSGTPPQVAAEPLASAALPKTPEVAPILPTQVSPPPETLLSIAAVEKWIPPAIFAAWNRANRQRKWVIVSAAAACLVLCVLTVTFAVAYVQSSIHDSSQIAPPPPATAPPLPPAAPLPSDPSQTAVLTQAAPPLPASASRKPRQKPPESLMSGLSKAFGGSDSDDPKPQINDVQLRAQVWASKNSGYYFCTDDPIYKTVQPGEFMTQGDALQSGYRSILGQFCD